MAFIYNGKEMNALSIKQPWASLIINGYKNIENRSWKRKKIGWVLVHSCATFDTLKNMKGLKKEVKDVLDSLEWKKFKTSAILGIMYINNIEEDCDVSKYKWASGPNCWHITKVYKFSKPINAKGKLGLWYPDIDTQPKIKKELDIIFGNTKLDIMGLCNNLNMATLDNMSKSEYTDIKKILNTVKTTDMSKVVNKPFFDTLDNFFNYKRPSKISKYDIWNKTCGYITVPLHIPDVDTFQLSLLKSANKWFHSHIGDGFPKLKNIDLTNTDTLYNIFDPAWKKKHYNKEQIDSIRNALNGGGNAQFQPYKGWRYSGFGIWTHIRGSDFVLRKALPVILDSYSKVYPGKIKSRSVPHIIFKPPSKTGGKLPEHIDSGTLNDMYFRSTYCKDLDQWIVNYGIQTLAHLTGARKGDGGQTTILGPMNVDTYFIILQLVHPKTVHPDMPIPKEGFDKLWVTASGPKFYPWYNKKTLTVINRVLKFLKNSNEPVKESDKKWVGLLKNGKYLNIIQKRSQNTSSSDIKCIKMLPKEHNTPYLVAWPNGFIHGSEPTGKVPRLTLTIPFGPVGNKSESDRVLRRIHNITINKFDAVLEDKTPYHCGIVHKSTKTEVEIYPFFKDMYIKNKDIKDIHKYM